MQEEKDGRFPTEEAKAAVRGQLPYGITWQVDDGGGTKRWRFRDDGGDFVIETGASVIEHFRITNSGQSSFKTDTATNTCLILQTTDDNTTNPLISCLDQAGTTELFAVEANGDATFSGEVKSTDPTGGIGYGTGAGALVVQATSKSTSVTISYVCGEITMNNASLAADTTVSFTMTNTTIAATDVLVLNHKSGGTAGAYTLNAQCGAGSAVINVRNVTTGSLAEAIVLQFVVIKAVTS